MKTNDSIVKLRIATDLELEDFKKNLQQAFKVSAEKEFGQILEEPIPSDADFEDSVNSIGAIVYQVLKNDQIAGGAIVAIDELYQRNKLLLFYINTNYSDRGVGLEAWKVIEAQHPETKIWETVTPYFEKRNIHFYVNKCGFKIVEYYSKYHSDPNLKQIISSDEEDDEMFKFEKIMK